MTGRERIVYEYIASSLRNGSISPSVRDIVSATGIGSTSTVSRILNSLEEQGLIRREKGINRSIQIDSYTETNASSEKRDRTVKVPILHDINVLSAGLPPENIEGYIDFPLMGKIYGVNSLFAFRASVDDMSKGILKGDIVIVKKDRSPETSSVFVALERGRIRILSSPESIIPQTLILGKIISVIRFY